jgi:heat shock protein HslJ
MKRLIPFALLAGCISTPDPAQPVLGGQFAIDQVAGAAVPAGSTPSIAIDGQRVSGDAGCNRFTTGVSHGPTTLTFGAIAATRMACADAARAQFEQAFVALLPQLTRWRLDGDRLTLSTADGRVVSGRRTGA